SVYSSFLWNSTVENVTKMCNKPSPYRDDKDECFVVIFNIFIKFGRLKITKIVTFLSLLFQFVFYLLQLCYVIIKFDQDLVMRYSCTIVMTLYVLYTTVFM
ncbi:unnamed protein product, partial [Tenebrio molitor]